MAMGLLPTMGTINEVLVAHELGTVDRIQHSLVTDTVGATPGNAPQGAIFAKTCVAVLRNRSRAAHWSGQGHCTMKTATIPVFGLTDRSVP